jgi:Trk K+ transport system NAD-binding subunit
VEVYQKDLASEDRLVDIEHIGEISVNADSKYCGQTIEELTAYDQIRVHLVIRGELTLIATGNLTVIEGDILVVESERLQKNGMKSLKRDVQKRNRR